MEGVAERRSCSEDEQRDAAAVVDIVAEEESRGCALWMDVRHRRGSIHRVM